MSLRAWVRALWITAAVIWAAVFGVIAYGNAVLATLRPG